MHERKNVIRVRGWMEARGVVRQGGQKRRYPNGAAGAEDAVRDLKFRRGSEKQP